MIITYATIAKLIKLRCRVVLKDSLIFIKYNDFYKTVCV